MLLYVAVIDFLDSGGPVVRTERQQFLQWGYRFHCSCEDCGLAGAAGAANDAARQRAVRLAAAWSEADSLARERRAVDQWRAVLTSLDSAGKQQHLLHSVQCGWETEWGYSQQPPAARLLHLAQLGLRLANTHCGAEDQEAELWRHRLEQLSN